MSPTVPPISVMTTSGAAPVVVGRRHRQDAVLDLVGDVRDDLDGVAEVLAAALLGDHGRVDLAGRDVRPAVQVPVEEALVVADVQVGLGAVLGDEHLAVLEGVHRAGVDVEVGIELLHRHPQAAGGEELAEARRGEAFAQRGRYPAGYEEMTRGARLHGASGYIHPPRSSSHPGRVPPVSSARTALGSHGRGFAVRRRRSGAGGRPVGRGGGGAVAAHASIDLLAQRQHGADLARRRFERRRRWTAPP